MQRTWLAVPALLLALTGCSGSDDSPAADVTPTSDSSSTAAQPDAVASVSLRSYPGFTSCQIDRGSFLIAEPMRVKQPDLGWKNREPLDGAQLSAGRYYVFVPVKTQTPGAHIDGLEVTWDEDGQSATDTAEIVTDFKTTC